MSIAATCVAQAPLLGEVFDGLVRFDRDRSCYVLNAQADDGGDGHPLSRDQLWQLNDLLADTLARVEDEQPGERFRRVLPTGRGETVVAAAQR